MKQLFLVITLLLLSVTVSAGDISREQAREKARQFLMQKSIDRTLVDVASPQSRVKRGGIKETDCFYVFNVGETDGFIIVSSDDRAPDILGYTDHGTFDADNLPPNFASWLQVYADEIRYMRESNEQPVTQTRSVKKAFAPVKTLLTCHWGQDDPYNMGYPKVNGQTCITGCVATALAQVLYYYKNPATTTEIPGYITSRHGIKMEPLPPTTFDWGNMTDEYNNHSTEVQKEAVAKLMFYCSTAVKANLDPAGTGAYSYQQLISLRNYFGFAKSAKQKNRGNLAQWEQMLYEEISAGRPVLYSGNANDGQSGHAFVLDGHDGELFHFNWGWKGAYDGNFAITALNPGYDFSYNQDAIVGISLTETEPPVYNEDVRLTTETFYPYNFKDYDKYYISSTDNGVNQYWGVKFGCKISSQLKGTYDIDNNYAIYKDGEFMEYLYPFEVENPSFGINYNMEGGSYFPSDYEELLRLPHSHNDGYGNISYGKSFQEPGTYLIIAVSRLHGDKDWKLNHGSKDKFLKCVVDEDHVLHLYKGAQSDFPDDADGIRSVNQDDAVVGRYDLNGRRVDNSYKGIVIEVQKNGRAVLRSSAKR
jgi:hypothetical protein